MCHLDNLILNTDSYKASHWLQYPPGVDATFFYVESRGGTTRRCFLACRPSSRKSRTPVTHADVDEARDFFAAHGEPFNEAGWRHIVDVHGGRLPMRIRAVPEGSVVPTHQALVTIESTDRRLLAAQLRGNAAAATVVSGHRGHDQLARETEAQGILEKTSDDPEGQLAFKLHDFGAAGYPAPNRPPSVGWPTW